MPQATTLNYCPDFGVHYTASNSAYTKITLKGSWFDHFPDFPIHSLHEFFKDHGGNPQKIDISFIDDEDHLNFEKYKFMSSKDNYLDYLTGSCLNSRRKKADCDSAKGLPDVRLNHSLIHYGNIKSNYVKMYQKEGKHAKLELTLQDKIHVKTLLDSYRPDKIEQFEKLAKQALVTALNFVTPETRNTRKPVQIDSYRNFLGSEIAKIKWSNFQPLTDIVAESFDSGQRRAFAQLQNLVKRFEILQPMIDDICNLQTKMEDLFYQKQEAF